MYINRGPDSFYALNKGIAVMMIISRYFTYFVYSKFILFFVLYRQIFVLVVVCKAATISI